MKKIRISETAFSTQVESLLSLYNWKWMHIKPSIMQSGSWASSMNPEGKGWLDYIAIRRGRVVLFELKDDYGKMTPEQEEWFNLWKECPGVELYLYRPKHIEDVIECLR